MTVDMTIQAIFAMDHCLANIDLNGLDAIARHDSVIQSLSTQCVETKEVVVDGKPIQTQQAKPGPWTLTDDQVKHVIICVEKMVNFGKVPGKLAKGYLDIVNAFGIGKATPEGGLPEDQAAAGTGSN
jgi:hypothetical protein